MPVEHGHSKGMYVADRVRIVDVASRTHLMKRISDQVKLLGKHGDLRLTNMYGIGLISEEGIGGEFTSVALSGITDRDLNGSSVEMRKICTQLGMKLPIDIVVQIPEKSTEVDDDTAYSLAIHESAPSADSRFFEAVVTPEIAMAELTDAHREVIERGQLLGDHSALLRIIDNLLTKKGKAIGTGF